MDADFRSERDIQDAIRLAVTNDMIVFRANVVRHKLDNGRWMDSGLPKGFSDLFGVRKSDGKAVFIEVKNRNGKPSQEQINFLNVMASNGALVGIARNEQQALDIINETIKWRQI